MTNDLETTLDALVVDAPVDRADWSDVVRRSRRPRRRRAILLAAGVAAIAVAVATPALGLGGRVLDLFQGTPASPEVQQVFAEWNRSGARWGATLGHVPPANVASARAWLAERFPRVEPSKAHGLFSIELGPGVIVQLWAAPITGGGVCSILLRADQSNDLHVGRRHASCITPTTPIAPRGRGGTFGMGVPGRGLKPGIAPGAASVELRFADGTTLRAPVVEGFYLVPIENPRIGSWPGLGPNPGALLGLIETQIVSYDAHGDKLAETTSEQTVIADYLGITVADFWTTDRPSYDVTRDTNTLAQMATDRGKSVSGLVEAIVAHRRIALDAQVASGQITAEEADSRLASTRRNADGMVHGVPPVGFGSQPVSPPANAGGGATIPAAAPDVSVVSVRTIFPPQGAGSPLTPAPAVNVVKSGLPVLVFEVTVRNGGDEQETGVRIAVTIDRASTSEGPSGSIVSAVTLDSIGPDETKAATVAFDDLQVTFGTPIALRVSVADGPERVYPVIFALPSP
jgi:hypothetical protein